MNNDTQLQIQAYLDNELSPGDARAVAALLSSDPEAREIYHSLKETKEILVQNPPVLKLQDSREFYWSRIERGIQSAERLPSAPARPWWMRLIVPAVGALGLFAILAAITKQDDRQMAGTGVTPTIAQKIDDLMQGPILPATDVSTVTFRSETEGMTVVWVSAR